MSNVASMRIGHGYDVHRLVEGRELILGGVRIPHTLGLLGHSDADVLVHAVLDALLGALGERDIGYHFPDSEKAYRGVSSLLLAERVAEILKRHRAVICNIDATLLAQRPKLSPHIPEMKSNLARALGCDEGCVSVKATTEEGLGFSGREEGIAAHAVCLLQILPA